MRVASRELSITWNPEAWPKWKEANEKSTAGSAKEFARSIALNYFEKTPALTGAIDMASIPLPGMAPSATPVEGTAKTSDALPGAADVATETFDGLKDYDIDPLWGQPRVVPAGGVRIKLRPNDAEYCRIQDGKIFFEGGPEAKTFSITDLPESAQLLFQARPVDGDALESLISFRLNDVRSQTPVTLRDVKTMNEKVSVSLGDRVITIIPTPKGGLFS